jgi:hypothetical protein
MSFKRLKKRFDIEIILLNNTENVFVDDNQDINKCLEIFLFLKKFVLNINMFFSKCYPFTPPNVQLLSIEETNYSDFLCNISSNFKEANNDSCLCCSSVICKNNWGPQTHLVDIVKEIIKVTNNCELEINKNIKKSIYLKYLGYNIT